MTKYRKKPVEVVIEAFQLTYEMAKGEAPVPSWFGEAINKGSVKVFVTDKIHNSQYCEITTLEGSVLTGDPNNYIVQGIKGEIYPCRKDIFELIYEEDLTLNFYENNRRECSEEDI